MKRALPTLAECRDSQGTLQLFTLMPGQIKKSVDLSDRNVLGPLTNLEDVITGADLAFLEHAEVKARPMVGND